MPNIMLEEGKCMASNSAYMKGHKMKIVYNNGKVWSGTLEDAIHAFSEPLKIGDCIQCKGNLYKIENISGAWAWAWWGGTPLGSLYTPTLEYAIPGSVDGVGVKDILGHLKALEEQRYLDKVLAAQRAENARALKAAEYLKSLAAELKAKQEAKQEAKRAENVRTLKAAEHLKSLADTINNGIVKVDDHLYRVLKYDVCPDTFNIYGLNDCMEWRGITSDRVKNSSAKFKVRDIVKSIGNYEATYKITSVWPTWTGWFYDMELEAMSGVRQFGRDRHFYGENAESLLSAAPKFAVGDSVKYLRGTNYYRVRAYKDGQYTLYNLNNGGTYYESKDSSLVAI